MRAPHRASVPADPRQWRPQVAVPFRRPPTIQDPIVEPLWSGWRVLVHFDSRYADETRLLDESGADMAASEPEVAAELSRAVLALDAVIDGILTDQATRSGEGVALLPEPSVKPKPFFMSRDPEVDFRHRGRDEPDAWPVALVCLDLLQVDGQSLLDVPLLERKRLLEGVIDAGDLVRVSPFTRPPVDHWVASWKASGFKGAMLKAANGRYVPGRASPDWVAVTRLRRGL